MKQFILRVIFFSVVTVIITIIITIGLNALVQKDGFYKVNDEVKYIVVGDSHPECAFNDSLIDNIQNFAQSGESYFYTYAKTKAILEKNPSIKTVFIEFNNGQLIENMDPAIWDDKHIISKFPKYAVAFSISDYYVLAKNNFSGFLHSQALSITRNYNLLDIENRTMHHLHWGRFKRLTNNGQEKLSELDTLKLNMDTSVVDHAITNLEYIQKLVNFCESQKVEVIFVRSPVHEKYRGRQNEVTFNYIRKKYFNKIPFWDYQDMKIEDHEFADVHHLNVLGAEKFSNVFNEDLRSMKESDNLSGH